MLMAPFLSCGAKFGVYILLISALFAPGEAGTVLFLLYILGLAMSVLTAFLLKRWGGLSVQQTSPPEASVVVRFPPLAETVFQTLRDGWVFLKSAGTVIVLASIVVWALTYWPGISKKEYDILKAYADQTGQVLPSRSSLSIHHSYAQKLGRLFEPVFRPLGQDWKSSVALLGGLTGKEVVVSTFITLYGMDHGPGSKKTLGQVIREEGSFTRLSAGSLMIFVLLSGSCLASMAMLFRHTRSYRQLLFFVCYPIAVAWIVSTLFYQVGRLFTG
jgi:ferrous iron transport protein B